MAIGDCRLAIGEGRSKLERPFSRTAVPYPAEGINKQPVAPGDLQTRLETRYRDRSDKTL